MIRFDVATLLVQWAAGGLAFVWVTTRRREVGIGYGWLMRSSYGLIAVGGVAVGRLYQPSAGRDLLASLGVAAVGLALVQSVTRRRAGVSGERHLAASRRERVSAMTGIERQARDRETHGPEFDPRLDLAAPVLLAAALVFAAVGTGGPVAVGLVRNLVGAAFLGAVTDAMLLGHWYLVQPGLPRAPLLELVRWSTVTWPFEIAVMLLPTGMMSVFTGDVDDGYGGLLGWTWGTSAVTTIGLLLVTRAALREREYSAVMAATGLLYLAILTAFGTDVIARAVLAG